MSQHSLISIESGSFSEFNDENVDSHIHPSLLKQKGSPRQSIAVTMNRLKRSSVLTQTKRSSRIQEQNFFQEYMDDQGEECADFAERIVAAIRSESSFGGQVMDGQIDTLCLSEDDVLKEGFLGYIRTKSGRGASLLVEGEDELEKVGLIQYEDGMEEMRRSSSFCRLNSDTFEETAVVGTNGEGETVLYSK